MAGAILRERNVRSFDRNCKGDIARIMNILMITKIFPPDRRIEREAQSLMDQGHKLFLMARRTPEQTEDEVVNGVRVIRYFLPFQKKKAISDFIYFFLQRYLLFFRLLPVCRKHRIDVIHVHDLPYAFAATATGQTLGIPVVFDMHENFPEMLKTSFDSKIYQKFKVFSFLLLNMMRIEEKIACRWARKIIVVADEHIPRISNLGVSREKIAVVTNTEEIDSFKAFGIDKSISEKFGDDFVILYIGAFDPIRGLDTAIKAMPLVLEKIPETILLLVGDGNNRPELEQLARELRLENRVVFAGYQKFERIPSYIAACDAGLIPHISNPHIETTMPNKIFQFMAMGKAVIVSGTRPMMRIVNDAKCGLIFRDRDTKALAEAIVQCHDPGLRRRLGENGGQAVIRRHNWRETARALIGIYSDLQSRFS